MRGGESGLEVSYYRERNNVYFVLAEDGCGGREERWALDR